MPTILVVTSTLPRWHGDSEPRFVLDLCQAISPHYRVVVLAPHCRGAAQKERWGEVEVRRFRYLPAWGEVLAYEGGILPKLRARPWLWALVPFFMIGLVFAVMRTLRREPVALIHAHWLIPQGFCVRLALLLARRRTPLVCTAHGTDVLGLRSALARYLQRWIARGCARIGVVSGKLRDELIHRGVLAEQIRLMPMGVAIPDGLWTANKRQPQLIAFAGRMVPKKGVEILLEAFAQLAEAFPDARLCLAGGGPDLEQYRRQAAALDLQDRVTFLGPAPHERVQALFAEAAVAVMPSESEGLGLVMLEAMAAGCPVVATDLPAVRSVIQPGENGLLFPERDINALARCFGQLLVDRTLAERLAIAGQCHVGAHFSWRAAAKNHQAIYADAMGVL